jgi:hypothetical protein
MRSTLAALIAAGFLAGVPAIADDHTTTERVSATITFAPELIETFEDDYGTREMPRVAEDLQRALARAFDREGVAVPGLRITIEEVVPNRPTMEQLGDTPGLSYGQSFGIGGARLSAEILNADGQIVDRLSYRWFETDIRESQFESDWGDARTAFNRFARRLVDRVSGA